MAIDNTKIKGLEVLLYVGGNVVAGQRGASLSMSADEIDITDKTTEGYKAFLAGLKEWSISCDGLVCVNDQGYEALVDAFLNADEVAIELRNGDSAENATFGYKGTVAIASMDFDAQYDDALTYSCELRGASALKKITDPEDPEGTNL